MREELISLFHVDPRKIHVLRPPVNTTVFRSELKTRQRSFRKEYDLPRDKRIFLFVSGSHERKGLTLLLDLFAGIEAEDALLVIAGLPPVRSRLGNVIDLQFVARMEELYAAADFTIHPASYEPFGQIVPESLCCNTPVLISDRVGAKEVVGEGEGLVIDLRDTDRWLHVVESASADRFDIAPDYAERNDLTIPGHVQRLLRIGRHVR